MSPNSRLYVLGGPLASQTSVSQSVWESPTIGDHFRGSLLDDGCYCFGTILGSPDI